MKKIDVTLVLPNGGKLVLRTRVIPRVGDDVLWPGSIGTDKVYRVSQVQIAYAAINTSKSGIDEDRVIAMLELSPEDPSQRDMPR